MRRQRVDLCERTAILSESDVNTCTASRIVLQLAARRLKIGPVGGQPTNECREDRRYNRSSPQRTGSAQVHAIKQ